MKLVGRLRRISVCLTASAFLLAAASPQIALDLKRGNEEWYLPTTDGAARLYVREMGKGKPVVVVHGGFGAEHGYLVDPLRFLVRDHRLIYYDQRGSLRSPCSGANVSIEKHVEDLEQIRRELKVERITLLGHSMGSYLACAYAEKYPQHVSGLVLIGLAYGRTPVTDDDRASQARSDKRFGEFIQRPEIQAELKKNGLDGPHLSPRQESRKWRITFAAANIFHIERWQQLQGGMVFYSQDAGSAAAKSMKAVDFIDFFARQRFPIAVINGSHDLVDMGGDIYRGLLRRAPNVDYTLVPFAGHNSWIDQPAMFREGVTRAVRKADAH